jgi:hypothetical protein
MGERTLDMFRKLIPLCIVFCLSVAACTSPSSQLTTAPTPSPEATLQPAPGLTSPPEQPTPAGENQPEKPTPVSGTKPPKQKNEPAQADKPKQSNSTGQANEPGPAKQYNIEQALSPNAQRNTIAFSALAFLTGDFNADTFFPPGKVADFWGFQYLRDNDPSGMGHNTDFLTYAALNMLSVMSDEQIAALKTLAESQVEKINEYAVNRFVFIDAFRRLLDGNLPEGTSELDMEAVQDYSAELYRLDGEITLERVKVMSQILNELTPEQREYLDQMVGQGMTDWPKPDEPAGMRGLPRDVKVNVMTYAGDLFSWYAGSIDADTYINPERQGTYFGAFYLKDAPAVGNPGYTISSSLTGDMGTTFLDTLDSEQRDLVEEIVNLENPYLLDIVDIRTAIATELRRTLAGENLDESALQSLMEDYGAADGALVYYFARNFARLGASLTAEQQAKLMELRRQMLGDLIAEKPFLYSQPVDMPAIPGSDFLFK